MRILVVEDDAKIAAFVQDGLEAAGFAVDVAGDGESGLALALATPYDCAVVDVMLPGLDGLALIRAVRARGVRTPTLILSAKRSVDDRVTGLNAGSDDYLTKPFAFAELLARVQALVRRATGAAEPTTLAVADLVLDLSRRTVTRAGRRIELQPKELALLEFLMRNAGRVVSKAMIIDHVWNYNFDPRTNVVEARMSRLRDKVDREFDARLIRTIRGAGYIIEAPRGDG